MPDPFTFVDLRFPDDGSVIDGLSFAVGPNEHVVLYGPNGGGKTTILRLIAGTAVGKSQPDVAYQPQTAYMFRGSLEKNLLLGLSEDEATRAYEFAETLGLSSMMQADAQTLSGGQAQRVALSRTLATEASLVLLDEPLAAINASDSDEVAHLIRSATSQRALIAVSHRIETVVALGARVLVVDEGEILQDGRPSDVMATPNSDRVAEIIGIGNVVTGSVLSNVDGLAELDCGEFVLFVSSDAEPGQILSARFGAETVALYASEPITGTQRNVIAGKVTEIIDRGRFAEVIVDVGLPVAALVTPGALDALGIQQGDDLWVAIKAASVSVARAD